MSWLRDRSGKHVYVPSARVVVPTTVSTSASGGASQVSDNTPTGDFVEYSGGSCSQSDICTGVCASDRSVTARGVAHAWIVSGVTRKLALSGIYEKTINGVPSGKTVVIVTETKPDGKTPFILAKTVDDEVAILTARLNALTGSE